MALELVFTTTQTTNGTVIKVDDTTGEYSADNQTGWGAPNDAITDVTDAYLTISLYTDSNTKTQYDDIDIYSAACEVGTGISQASDLSDLVWEIKAQDLKESGTSPYTEDQVIPDGVWEIQYWIETDAVPDGTPEYTTTNTVLLNYTVKSSVYELFRTLPDNYAADICNDSDINKARFAESFLKALEYSASCGNIGFIIENLTCLQNILANDLTYGCSCN